ncbi:hypothetical protein NDU88_011170 [Pleurodeles waltl]|uniref:Ig-like domain-containing protein n=1 Tax=Pleurodeles waltl TaxID=8319 RepID=A0AAV7PY34_PLEWA|nr:hypothetical protein NDU88_011170 [Pleurodeles waltl]
MALRIFEALCVIQALCLLPAWAGTPRVLLEHNSDTVLEGDDVTLECLSDDVEDMSGYTFQKYSKWMRTWLNLNTPHTFRCWYYDVNITRSEGRLLLHIEDIQPWQVGPYRCVARDGDNSTEGNATTSESFTIPFYYVRNVYISRVNVWCGTVGSEEFIEEGSDVELRCRAETDSPKEAIYEWSRKGDDWIVASKTLILKKFGKEDAGIYTCQARHPVLFNLVKSKSVQLQVVEPAKSLSAKFWPLSSEDAWQTTARRHQLRSRSSGAPSTRGARSRSPLGLETLSPSSSDGCTQSMNRTLV